MVHYRDFVFVLTSLWTSTLPVIPVVWTTVEGQPRVIGSLKPIVATLGDDVILPCHLEPQYDVEGLTVEWSKPDLKPDPSDRLSRVDYVHLYRNWHTVTDMQIQSYSGRTELDTDLLKYGDISLRITNVTLEDGGRYRCFIPKLKSPVKDSIIVLVVDPDFVKKATTETPLHPNTLQTPDQKNQTNVEGDRSHLGAVVAAVVFSLLLIMCGVGGFLLQQKYPKQNLLMRDVTTNKSLLV